MMRSDLMRIGSRKSGAGFSLLELAVVTIIIMVGMWLFLDRARLYQEQAEKTAMEGVVSAIQIALTLQYGEMMIQGRLGEADKLVRENPMEWLQPKPNNYAGAFDEVTADRLSPGNWMYDRKAKQLVYALNNQGHFQPGPNGEAAIRFHVVLDRATAPATAAERVMLDLTGVLFQPLRPYSWF